MKRLKIILLFSIMFITIMCLTNITKAANAQLGTVTALSSGANSFDGNVENVEISFNELNLEWYKADLSIGRPVDGYWVGYKIEAPSFVNSVETAQKVKYRRKMAGQSEWVDKSFMEVKDGEWYMTAWAQVTQERLDQNKTEFVLYEAEFDWNGDGQYEQSVSLKINPTTTTLDTDKKASVIIKEAGKGASGTTTTFNIYKGTILSEGITAPEKETLDAIKNKEGFVGFYKLPTTSTIFEEDKIETYTKFNPEEDVIDDEEVLVIAYFNVEEVPEPDLVEDPNTTETEEPEENEAPVEEPKKDETPKTGDIGLIGYAMLTIVASVMGIVVLNRKKIEE